MQARGPKKAANHVRFCLFFVYRAERVGRTQLGGLAEEEQEGLGGTLAGAIIYLKYHVGGGGERVLA